MDPLDRFMIEVPTIIKSIMDLHQIIHLIHFLLNPHLAENKEEENPINIIIGLSNDQMQMTPLTFLLNPILLRTERRNLQLILIIGITDNQCANNPTNIPLQQ